ncbi:MAG: hypothetical protein ACHQT8_08215 [Chlamydiales bacterium]
MSAISKLPDAILTYPIFHYFTGRELWLTVQKVDKQWKRSVESREELVARINHEKDIEHTRIVHSLLYQPTFSAPHPTV